MDFTDATPRWRPSASIQQPLATTKAVVLPDGKVLIGHGVNRGGVASVGGGPCTFYEEREGHHFQMFDPATCSITRLARTTVSRGLHGTATLLPDGTVFFAGENREALVRPDDPSFPLMASCAGGCRPAIRTRAFPSGRSSTRRICSRAAARLHRGPSSRRRPARSRTAGTSTSRIAGRSRSDRFGGAAAQRPQHAQPHGAATAT